MDIQSTLTDFLAYLYENNIDIRDKKYDWQAITKDFIDKSGCANMTKAELKRALKLINNKENNNMKLYLFDPNDWGMRFFVMAENKIEAHKYLLAFIQSKIDDPMENTYKDMNEEDLEIWKNVNPLDANSFPQKYSLKEFEAGTVKESELA